MWLISTDCHELLDAIPVLVADEDKDGDIVKTDSVADDIADTARYGLKSFPSSKQQPKEEERKEMLDSFDDQLARIRARRNRTQADGPEGEAG